MAELTERELQELTGALNPHRRPLMYALLANLALGVVFFGWPYVRGHQLARAERESFVAFARCLIGGEVASSPGLSLPRGEREHYAAKVLFAEPSWPLSCKPILTQMRPPDATLLWPSLKTAGVDLRAAVELMEREITQLSERRKKHPGRVPARPLNALQRLQAASVLYARAGDITRDLDNDGLVLDAKVSGLATPARLPLMIGDSQNTEAWSHTGTLEVMALDAHSLAYLRVEDGKVDRQRLRRNGFLRGVVRADDTPYLVWAMPEAKCAEQAEHCVKSTTGLARYDKGSTALGEPSWKLPGHPAGRIDRVLSVTNTGRVDFLIPTNATGGLELMRLRLSEPAAAAKDPERLLADEWWPITESAVGTSATLVPGEPLAVLRASAGPEGTDSTVAELVTTTHPPQITALPPAAGSGAWALACGAAAQRWIAYGSARELHVGRADTDKLLAQTTALTDPIHESDRTKDHVRLVCLEQTAQLLYVDSARVLWQITCRNEGCEPAREVARDVTQFDAVRRADQTVIAFHSGPEVPTIRVLRLDATGQPAGQPAIVASCWEPLGGMCGNATWVSTPERLVLLARDGPDMLALETVNDGYSFASLSGFAGRNSAERDTTSPMQQHRVRKGID